MGQVGSTGDNTALESFFSLLQDNVLNRRRWATRELRLAIIVWIDERTYPRRRRQARLGHLAPVEYETINTPQVAHAPETRRHLLMQQPRLTNIAVMVGSPGFGHTWTKPHLQKASGPSRGPTRRQAGEFTRCSTRSASTTSAWSSAWCSPETVTVPTMPTPVTVTGTQPPAAACSSGSRPTSSRR